MKLLLFWIPNFQHHLPFAVHWASLSTAGRQRVFTSTAGARRPCQGSVVPAPWWTIALTPPARPQAATTPLNDPCPVKGECRIACEHSESAWKQRVALYKSDQQQQGWVKYPAKDEWSPSLGLNSEDLLLKAVESLGPSEACSHAQMDTCVSPWNWTLKKKKKSVRVEQDQKNNNSFCRDLSCVEHKHESSDHKGGYWFSGYVVLISDPKSDHEWTKERSLGVNACNLYFFNMLYVSGLGVQLCWRT